MNDTTNSNLQEASVDKLDEIADLLITDPETDTEESSDQTEESTVEESENNTEEETDEQETETEEDEESSETEESESDEESGDTWAAALGVDDALVELDDSGNLSGIVTKVDGVAQTVSVKDLISGYQNNKFNTQKSQTISEEKKVFEQERQKLTEEVGSKINGLNDLMEYVSNKFVNEHDNVNWEILRVEDPAEYAAMRQDFSRKAQELKDVNAAMAQERDNLQQEFQRDQHSQQKEYLNGQFEIMVTNNPEWKDKEVYKSSMSDMKTFLADTYGFQDGDFEAVHDARLFELIKDARAYRKGKISASAKMKQKVPKFQKSKNKVAPKKRVSKVETLTKKAKNARPSDKRALQSDAIAQLLLGG